MGISMSSQSRLPASAGIVQAAATSRRTLVLRTTIIVLFASLSTLPLWAQSQNLAELSLQGRAALRDQQFDRARGIYEQVVKLDPRSAEAHSNLGFALYMTDSYHLAVPQGSRTRPTS
jgi:hypothetical protein